MQTVAYVQAPMHLSPMVTGLVHVVDHDDAAAVTHAIVIGIGTYPWGGSIPEAPELPDLESPVRSAVAIADWLIKDFHHPNRPLASVTLVVSDSDPFTYHNPNTKKKYVVPRGTTEELKACVQQWAQRSAGNFENGAIFYFCGHGISSGQSNCLLSRSFGENLLDYLAGAFEPASLVHAMRFIGPRHQLFLFDACRSECPKLFDKGTTFTPFLSVRPSMSASDHVKRCTLYSTAEGEDAFGDTNGVSHFARELLSACKSAAEDQRGWCIRTYLILRHMTKFLHGQACQFEGEDIEVHHLQSPPEIPVSVSCEPTEHIGGVQLEFCSEGTLSCKFNGEEEAEADCWHLSLVTGFYELSATASVLNDFKPFKSQIFHVYPPFSDIVLDLLQGTILR